MNLGERIYALRNEKNLSQGDLADALDVSRQSVSKWENNMAVPDLDKLIKLCDVFEISLDEIVGREATEKTIVHTVSENYAPKPKTAGFVMLGVTILGSIILFVASPPAVMLGIPLTLCTIICFKAEKYSWFWCLWAVYLSIEFYLSVGIKPGVMHIAKTVFLVVMTLLNIVCIRDTPALPKNKRMIILIISELLVFACIIGVSTMFYLNTAGIGYTINPWIYRPIYTGLTALIGISIYQIIGFIREAIQNKGN
ncbi:MAG: helix-turn-helix transcriptional regulator [Clostridia bacterium]|nr:helix-turn-helix transcriptional regulator [Clostridia bacterium]